LSTINFLERESLVATGDVPFYLHDLGPDEVQALSSALHSPLLTTGPRVADFESAFADFLEIEFALCVSSCTAAMHLALESLGIGRGDEVIVPNVTFAASALAVLHTGAEVVLVDTDPETGLLDLDLVANAVSTRTRAIIPVHLYGQMVDMYKLSQIAADLDLFVVEDAAHAIESVRDGVRPGQLSDAAAFSFFATKNITCGEGGALVTRNPSVFERVRASRTHGMTKTSADRMLEGYKPWDIPTPGWKYNLSDIQAAMLKPQLARISENLGRRASAAAYYDMLLGGLPVVMTPKRLGEVHALHLYTLQLPPQNRAACISLFRRGGIQFTVNYEPLSSISSFKDFRRFPRELPESIKWGSQTLSLPFYPGIPTVHMERVCAAISEVVGAST
jgi:UDP-4-amino-4-deoxy-L-arabinose-oxoglutarate aminotransferase